MCEHTLWIIVREDGADNRVHLIREVLETLHRRWPYGHPIALSIYSINCMMVGQCVVWSYVQAIVLAIWVLLFMTATFISREHQYEMSQSAQYVLF